jgi:hypothetical protein
MTHDSGAYYREVLQETQSGRRENHCHKAHVQRRIIIVHA